MGFPVSNDVLCAGHLLPVQRAVLPRSRKGTFKFVMPEFNSASG